MERMISALLAVATIAALSGAGTYAAFSDTESSQGNLVAAHTLDFTLEEQISWTFPFTLAPGGSTGEVELELERVEGTMAPNHTEVNVVPHSFVDGDVEPGGQNTAEAFQKQIHVEKLVYVNGGTAALLDCVDPSLDGDAGNHSLYDVDQYGVFDLDDRTDRSEDCAEELSTMHLDGIAHFRTEMSLSPTTNNTYQGDAIQVDYRFGAVQEPGQDVLG